MNEDFGSSYLERASETPEEVVLRRELVRTPGLQPEDIGVLAELLLRDPRLPSTMEAIRGDLQAQGWRMGKDRYNAIAGRLTKAGHLARISAYDEATQRPTWVTRVYRNPANNQQYVDLGISASVQVGTEVRETRDPEPKPTPESRETRVSPGQSRNAENPQSGGESRETRDSETRVSPGQSRNAENPDSAQHPPHTPPGGLVNPPTVPPEATKLESVVAAVAGGDNMRVAPKSNPAGVQELTEAELHTAGEFLADLPGRWACGLQDVEKYARQLAEAAKRQGWPLDAEFERWLTADERSIRGAYPRVIPARLRNLPRYSAWRRAGSPTGSAANRGPVEDACPNHPHRAAADCVPCRIDPDDPEQKPAERPFDPVPADVIAAAKAFARSGKSSGRRREKNPRGDARARRQAADARSAAAEAEAEENRRKAATLLQQDAAAALGLPTVPGQAHNHPAPR